MKKLFSLFIIIICATSLFAVNSNKMYKSSDFEAKAVKEICIQSGVLYPTNYPVSGEELFIALDRVPIDNRDNYYKDLYLKIKTPNTLIEGGVAKADLTFNLNTQLYIHKKEIAKIITPSYRDIPPMAAIIAEAGFSDSFYFILNFMEKDAYSNKLSFSNWATLLDKESPSLSQAFQPFEVGMSAGNNFFNLQIARNRQSFGRGVTGNLMVADNFSYQEYIKLTWFSPIIDYTLSITHFDNQIGPNSFEQFRLNGMHNLRVMHNVALSLFDKLEARVYLGATFETDSALDWRLLTPFNILHSFNNFSESHEIKPGDEANNIFGFEITYMLAKCWKSNFQFVMDQYQLKYESTDSVPNALGYLFNIEQVTRINKGSLHSHLEFALTDPWLYLNHKFNDKGENFNFDHVYGYSISGGDEIGYTGYVYGPDCLVITLGSEYTTEKYNVGLSLMYLAHGDHGINSNNPTLKTYNGENKLLSPIKEQYIVLNLQGYYDITSYLRINAKYSQAFIDSYSSLFSFGFSLSF